MNKPLTLSSLRRAILLAAALIVAIVSGHPAFAAPEAVKLTLETLDIGEYPDWAGGAGQYRVLFRIGGIQKVSDEWIPGEPASNNNGLPIRVDVYGDSVTNPYWDFEADGPVPIEVLVIEGDAAGAYDRIDLNPLSGEYLAVASYDGENPSQTLPASIGNGGSAPDGTPDGFRGTITFRAERLTPPPAPDVVPDPEPEDEPPVEEPVDPSCERPGTHVDSDGDGLLDGWETHGWDADCDGDLEVDLPFYGADPNHKDIFVEIDWLFGSEPSREMIENAKQVFADAPLTNPDGTTGIRLWLDVGPLQDANGPIGDNLGGGNPMGLTPIETLNDVVELKQQHFLPDHMGLFRYGVMSSYGWEGPNAMIDGCTNGLDDDNDGLADFNDPDCQRDNGGQGNLTSGDFFARLIPCEDSTDEHCFTRMTGLFVHELSHTSALRHGGDEQQNCKPNYVSSMNYLYAYGIPLSDGSLTVDLSPIAAGGQRMSDPLVTLDELNLDETQILETNVPVGNVVPNIVFNNGNNEPVQSPSNERIDWNGDGDTNDTNTFANIDAAMQANGTRRYCEQDVAIHAGHDDWGSTQMKIGFSMLGGMAAPDAEDRDLENMPTYTQAMELYEAIERTDLRVQTTLAPASVLPGRTAQYRVDLVNQGPNPAYGTTFVIDLPSNTRAASTSLGRACQTRGQRMTCSVGALLARKTRTLSISILADSRARSGADFTPTFRVSHRGEDTVSSNNADRPRTRIGYSFVRPKLPTRSLSGISSGGLKISGR